MRNTGLFGLLAVTVAAVVVAVMVSLPPSGPAVGPLVGKPVLPDLAKESDQITRIAILQGPDKVTLLREGDHWTVEELSGYPADGAKVTAALAALGHLAFLEPKTAKADLYPRLEVEDAAKPDAKSTMVTLADAKGTPLGELLIGKRRTGDIDPTAGDATYLRKQGEAQSWLARGTVDIPALTTSWVDHRILDLSAAEVTEAVLTQPGGATVTVQHAEDGKLKLAELPAGGKLKREAQLDETIGALSGLALTNVRPAKDEDFPKDKVATARFTAKDGLVVTAELNATDPAVTWARFALTGSGPAEARAKELAATLAGWAYALPRGKAATLTAKLADLVEPAKGS